MKVAVTPLPSESGTDATLAASTGTVGDLVSRIGIVQRDWAARTVASRAAYVVSALEAMVANADKLVDGIMAETSGSPYETLVHDVAAVAHRGHRAARMAEDTLSDRRIPPDLLSHGGGIVRFAPVGIVAVLGCSRDPFAGVWIPVLDALLAGNGVVLKVSSAEPCAAVMAITILRGAGFPKDLVARVVGDDDIDEALLDAGVGCVVFSGSESDARRVAALCGRRLTPCVLHLVGSTPVIARDDCNLDLTVEAVIASASTQPQGSPGSTERVYAHNAVYRAIAARVAAVTPRVTVVPFASDDDAVAEVNALETFSAACVFGRDVARAQSLADRLVAGTVRINGWVWRDADDPREALRAMCRTQRVFDRNTPLAARARGLTHSSGRYRLARTALGVLYGRYGWLGRIADLW